MSTSRTDPAISGLVASVAVIEDDVLLAESTLDYKKTHSQTLLPMLEEVRNMIELDLQEVDAVAVAAGPGSFTGLRIGSASERADAGRSLSVHMRRRQRVRNLHDFFHTLPENRNPVSRQRAFR